MRIWRSIDAVPADLRTVVTIGNFDGVHLGHRAVIDRVKAMAADLDAATARNYDLTVEWYFAPDSALYATGFRREIDGLVVRTPPRQI